MIVETWPLASLARDVVAAAAHGVEAPDDRERRRSWATSVYGPKYRAQGYSLAGDQHPRERVSEGDGDGGIALVVLEADVESGPILLMRLFSRMSDCGSDGTTIVSTSAMRRWRT